MSLARRRGDVGIAQDRLGLDPILRQEGDADADRDQQLLVADLERALKVAQQTAAQALGVLGPAEPQMHDHELVAADAGHSVGAAHVGLKPLAHRTQEPVAGPVAQAVVHLLEAIEVYAEHGRALAGGRDLLDRLLQPLVQERAVRQLGQGVVQGQELGP
jgi:hypothetical protein